MPTLRIHLPARDHLVLHVSCQGHSYDYVRALLYVGEPMTTPYAVESTCLGLLQLLTEFNFELLASPATLRELIVNGEDQVLAWRRYGPLSVHCSLVWCPRVTWLADRAIAGRATEDCTATPGLMAEELWQLLGIDQWLREATARQRTTTQET